MKEKIVEKPYYFMSKVSNQALLLIEEVVCPLIISS